MMKNKYQAKDIFFTSDPHYYHKNIIRYCNRPFNSVEEMNTQLILNWNKVVPANGIVFILGDFAFTGNDKVKNILEQLNGHKHLILGNHDHNVNYPQQFPYFESVNEQLLIRVLFDDKYQDIFLNHYPMISWEGSGRDTIQLYGHVHGVPGDNKIGSAQSYKQYDVGVDNNNFTPVSFYQIQEIFRNVYKRMLQEHSK